MDMTAPQPIEERQDFAFSDREFRMISELANERYGLFLQPSKKALVHSRLSKRLRILKLGSFEEYCALLNNPEGDSERPHLLSALTTNVTHFFREMHHFEFLKEKIAPKLMEKARAGHPVRLWSSACSSGQEAFSMAAALLAACPQIHEYDVKILATDIDPKVIETARRGRFPADQITAVPPEWQSTLMEGPHRPGADIEIGKTLQAMISFGELNLIDTWPMRRKFDVIFCRNAAIYFDKATQARLWKRFAEVLVDDGHLMIGHSERLSGPAESQFSSVGITTYQKQNGHHTGGTSQKEGDKT